MNVKKLSVGERIKLFRQDRAVSQKAMAETLGVSYQSIGLWEKGTNNPSTQSIKFIAMAYGVSEEWLRTGEGQMQKDDPDRELIENYKKLNEDAKSCVRKLVKLLS